MSTHPPLLAERPDYRRTARRLGWHDLSADTRAAIDTRVGGNARAQASAGAGFISGFAARVHGRSGSFFVKAAGRGEQQFAAESYLTGPASTPCCPPVPAPKLRWMQETGDPAEEKASLGGLVAYAATAAAVFGDPKIYRSQHTVRRMLVTHIREAEAEAYQVPAAERITEVSEAEARTFLDAIFQDGFPLGEPGELTLPELDILTLAQRHLLHTKADASTPEQIVELKRCIAVILQSSIDAFSAARPAAHTAPNASFPGSARAQPKRKKPKSKR